MNRNAVKYLQEFVIIQMNHWVLFPLFLMPMAQFRNIGLSGEPNIWFWTAMGFLPLCFYLLRKHLKHLGLVMLGHLAVMFVFISLANALVQSGRSVYLFFGVGYGVYSLYVRLNRSDVQDIDFPIFLMGGFFLISCFFTRYLGCLSWDSYYIFTLVFVIGLYFMKSYLDNYLSFLLLNENSAGHIPEREMFASGSVLALLFTVGSMAILLLLSNLRWLQGILYLLRVIFLAALRFLFSLFPLEMSETQPEQAQSGTITKKVQEQLEASEPSLFWDILFGTITVILLCFLLYRLFVVIKRFILFVKSRIYQENDSPVRTVGYLSDIREKCTAKDLQRGFGLKKLSFLQVLNPRERIRNLYKKHILQAKLADGSDNSAWELFTAREWGTILEEPDMPDIYEKARYSEEICTAEDVKRMKTALRRKTR